MRPIIEGDMIDIYWVNNGERLQNVRVISMPSNTGDLLYVEDFSLNKSRILGINTASSNFDLIELKTKGVQ